MIRFSNIGIAFLSNANPEGWGTALTEPCHRSVNYMGYWCAL